jgi:hypothetical protein
MLSAWWQSSSLAFQLVPSSEYRPDTSEKQMVLWACPYILTHLLIYRVLTVFAAQYHGLKSKFDLDRIVASYFHAPSNGRSNGGVPESQR